MSRPKTKAAQLNKLDPLTVNSRSKLLSQIIGKTKLLQNKKWLKWSGTVRTVAYGREDTILARNCSYKLVGISNTNASIGQLIQVKIEKVTPSSLIGSILND